MKIVNIISICLYAAILLNGTCYCQDAEALFVKRILSDPEFPVDGTTGQPPDGYPSDAAAIESNKAFKIDSVIKY